MNKKLLIIVFIAFAFIVTGCGREVSVNISDDDEVSTTSNPELPTTTTEVEDTHFTEELKESVTIELVENPVTDEMVAAQLEYIEESLEQSKAQADLQKAFKDYFIASFDDTYSGDSIDIRSMDFFFTLNASSILDLLDLQVGDYFYRYYGGPSSLVLLDRVTETTEESISFEGPDGTTRSMLHEDLIHYNIELVLNLLKTRRVGTIIFIFYDMNKQAHDVLILYVNGPDNQINQIIYDSTGSRTLNTNRKLEPRSLFDTDY